MHIIKLSFKHIAALPTHQLKKSCMNFDQAIVFFSTSTIQGADDKLGQVSRRCLKDVTLCEW